MQCKACQRDFPEHLMTVVNYSHANPICPLCALALRNKIHGLPSNTKFEGEIANDMWEEAMAVIRSRSIYPMGGHMINPPEDCPRRKVLPDGGVWADYPVCSFYCEDKCSRYYQFQKMTEEERKEELRNNGVMNT